MKVRYSLRQELCYAGIIELTEAAFKEMNSMDDTELGELILDRVGHGNPTDWHIEDVDEFEKVPA